MKPSEICGTLAAMASRRSSHRTILLILGLTVLASALPTAAQEDRSTAEEPESTPVVDTYARGRILRIVVEGEHDIDGYRQPYQELQVQLQSGPNKGDTITLEHRTDPAVWQRQRFHEGEEIVLVHTELADGPGYTVADRFRLPAVGWLLAGFLALAIVLGRRRGLTALLGLGVSYAILAGVLIPRLVAGGNATLWGIGCASIIAVASLFLAHGLSRRTTIAVVSTLLTLGLATGFGFLAVQTTRLLGLGSDDALALQLGLAGTIDLRGLLLVGIVIGTLGILDDTTTTQAATVDELAKANPSLSSRELFRRGLVVGREHIAALINTLALAYAGASLPLILVFSANASAPAWVALNSETIIEEVVRTLVGSAALMLAVPLTTALAARWLRQAAPLAGRPKTQ